MRDALKRLLKEIVPPIYGGTVMVSDEVLVEGDERFMAEIRRKIAQILANFITDSKVLDGADQSCFTMKPHESLQATECTARVHVLTPNELEALLEAAYEAGAAHAQPKGHMDAYFIPWEEMPRGNPPPPWKSPPPPWKSPGYESPHDFERMMRDMQQAEIVKKRDEETRRRIDDQMQKMMREGMKK